MRLRWTGVFALFLVLAVVITPTRLLDWQVVYKPAAQAILHGRSPYTSVGYFPPPWAAVLVIPFTLGRAGEIVLMAVILFTVTRISRYMGASVLSTILVLISPPMYWLIRNAQVDWLVLWGTATPAPIAILLASIKPQIGVGLAIWLVVHAWRHDGGIRALAVSIPFVVILLGSFALVGFWVTERSINVPYGMSYNVSLWPWGVPFGIVLLGIALWRDKMRYALLAGPLLAPYLLIYSYIGFFIALSRWTWVMILVVAVPYALGFVWLLVG